MSLYLLATPTALIIARRLLLDCFTSLPSSASPPPSAESEEGGCSRTSPQACMTLAPQWLHFGTRALMIPFWRFLHPLGDSRKPTTQSLPALNGMGMVYNGMVKMEWNGIEWIWNDVYEYENTVVSSALIYKYGFHSPPK